MAPVNSDGGPIVEAAAVDGTEGVEVSRRTLLACREFLKSLGKMFKLIALYDPKHPVAQEELQRNRKFLEGVFAGVRWDRVTFSLVDGRWLVNGTMLAEASGITEGFLSMVRNFEISSITFLRGALPYEFQALSALAAIPPGGVADIEAADLLKQQGVTRIRIDGERYTRQRKLPTERPKIESPLARRGEGAGKKKEGEDAGGKVSGGPGGKRPGGFGEFIKGLIDQSVEAPEQRAALYKETVQMVKSVLDKRVDAETSRLRLENKRVTRTMERTEHVLHSVAEGKIVVDKNGCVLNMDGAAEEILGKRLVEVAGKPILENVDPDEHMAALSQNMPDDLEKSAANNVGTAGSETVRETFRKSMALLHDEEGRVVGTYNVLPEITKFREAVKLQEEFISNVTHDLKAPLASICSAIELVDNLSAAQIGPEAKKFLEISRRNTKKLQLMINEILDFSKLESGKMSVTPTATPILPILIEAIEGLQPWAQSKNLRLEFVEPGGPLPEVQADYGRVVQVLTNLISNSIKVTPAQGRIAVSAAPGRGEHADCVVVSVEDTGCGIAPEDHRRIFDKFTQAGGFGGRREGVGLGLSIVNEIVRLHGGSVWLRSEPGQGATFFFSLRSADILVGGNV